MFLTNKHKDALLLNLELSDQDLQIHRVSMVIGAILIPLLGFFYLFLDGSANERMVHRFAIAGVWYAVTILSYFKDSIRRHILKYNYLLYIAFLSWFIWLTHQNGFSLNYTVGMLASYCCLCAGFHKSKTYLVLFIVLSVGLVYYFSSSAFNLPGDPNLLTLFMLMMGGIFYLLFNLIPATSEMSVIYSIRRYEEEIPGER